MVCLNVTMKVLVLLLPPEPSLIVMFVMSDTACDLSLDNISCSSQSMSSLHLITPLQEFSDLCGVTMTGRSIMNFKLFIWRLWVAEETSRRKSPLRSFLIDFNVPIAHLIDLSMANGDSSSIGLVWSSDRMTKKRSEAEDTSFCSCRWSVSTSENDRFLIFLSTMNFQLKRKPWWVCWNSAS